MTLEKLKRKLKILLIPMMVGQSIMNPALAQDKGRFEEKFLRGIPLVVDTHMHLLGLETDKTGCYLNPKALSKTNPINYIKSKIMMNACGVSNLRNADKKAWTRLSNLINTFPEVPYVGLVFAFAATHNKKDGKINLKKTAFHVPNQAILDFASQNKRVIPVGSIHPYQGNLQEELKFLADHNVKFLKILPNSMHFNPSDDACDSYFKGAESNGMTIITHVGDEHSVSFAGIDNDHGNPMLYKRWLDLYPGLKIIFAHVGSEGESNFEGKKVDNFHLVMKILRDKKYEGRVFADISAFTSAPFRIKYLNELIQSSDVHSKLFFGSDYPLPAIKLTSLASLLKMKMDGLISGRTRKRLTALLKKNPLAFNFAAMRSVAFRGERLPDAIFGENFKNISPEISKLVEALAEIPVVHE